MNPNRSNLAAAMLAMCCAGALLAAILCWIVLGVSVKVNKTVELVGPTDPIYFMIHDGSPLHVIEIELRKNPWLATEFVSQGASLLFFAVDEERDDVVKLLLEMGADPNGAPGDLPPLMAAISNGNVAIVRTLMDQGASPFSPIPSFEPQFELTPYELSLNLGNEEIVALMREAKSRDNQVEQVDEAGREKTENGNQEPGKQG